MSSKNASSSSRTRNRYYSHKYTGALSTAYTIKADSTSGSSCTNDWNMVLDLIQSEIRGTKPSDIMLSYYGKQKCPNNLQWILKSREEMYCGIFNKNGDQYFCASQDGIVRVFECNNKGFLKFKREIVCQDYGWSIVSLDQSSDQQHLAFGSLCSVLNLVNLASETSKATQIPLLSSSGLRDVFCLSYCGASSTQILCARNKGRVTLCNTEIGTCVDLDAANKGLTDINAVAALDDSGNTFVAGGDDTCIRMFDTRTLNEGCVASFPGHIDGITYIDSKNDGRYFLSNSKDQTVRLWDARNHSKAGSERRNKPKERWDYRIHRVPRSYCTQRTSNRGAKSVITLRGHTVRTTLIRARFSPIHTTGQQFAYAGSACGDWHVWDLTTGALCTVNRTKYGCVRDVAWHPLESRAIAASLSGGLSSWHHKDAGNEEPTPSEEPTLPGSEFSPRGFTYELPNDSAQSGLMSFNEDNETDYLHSPEITAEEYSNNGSSSEEGFIDNLAEMVEGEYMEYFSDEDPDFMPSSNEIAMISGDREEEEEEVIGGAWEWSSARSTTEEEEAEIDVHLGEGPVTRSQTRRQISHPHGRRRRLG